MSERIAEPFDSWGEGQMRTRHDFDGVNSPRVFDGEVDPGEYTNCVEVSQEISVLSGTIYCIEEGDGSLQVYRPGQKFTLQCGRTYTFKMKEKVTFHCAYLQ